MLSIVGTPQQAVVGSSMDSLLPAGQEVRAAIKAQMPKDEEEEESHGK